MSLLLYGIVAEGTLGEFPDPSLRACSAAGLAAVAAIRETPDPSVEAVLAFGEMVAFIHARTTVIPLRYGTLVADETALAAHLSERAGHYRALLAELDDCEEMGIRLPLPPAPETEPPQGGRDYLLALKRKYSLSEQAEAQAAALNEALAGLYRRQRAEVGTFNRETMALLSYLVPRPHLAAFQARAEDFARAGRLDGYLSGPWPPYNFV